MAQSIAIGVIAATGAEFTVASGASAGVALFAATSSRIPDRAFATVERKGSNGTFYGHTVLTAGAPDKKIEEPGTYRVRKGAGTGSFGVDVS